VNRWRRLIVTGLLAVGPVLLVSPGLALAQTSTGPRSPAQSLIQALVGLNTRYRLARPIERARLVNQLLATAARRQQALASLVESDQGEVLRIALPPALRASLPSAVRVYVEKQTAVEGTLLVLHEDSPTGGRYRYFLESTTGWHSLHFATHPPTHLLSMSPCRPTSSRTPAARPCPSQPERAPADHRSRPPA